MTRRPSSPPLLVSRDPGMTQLSAHADRVARGSINVLVLGETGVGKGVLAERIHRASPRREEPFVRIDCSLLTEALLERELFGYERVLSSGPLQLARVGSRPPTGARYFSTRWESSRFRFRPSCSR